jgi:Uma2 family endonuclease
MTLRYVFGGKTMSTITMPPAPSPAQTPPPRSSGLKPHRFTISEYRKLGETGLFHDMKTMLLHGELFTMGMPKPPHDFALNATYEFLRSICPAAHHVRNQQGFDIGIDSDPGPDLAIVPGVLRDYATTTPTAAILIVEVAHTTLAVDTTTKAELYATAGVPEYWVIDLEHQQLIVFRDPQPLPQGLGATAYKTHLTFGPTDRVSPLAAPQAAILVSELLP